MDVYRRLSQDEASKLSYSNSSSPPLSSPTLERAQDCVFVIESGCYVDRDCRNHLLFRIPSHRALHQVIRAQE